MYTQLCILKLVTCVHTYKQNFEAVYTRCVLLYTHSSVLKFITFLHHVAVKHGSLKALKSLLNFKALKKLLEFLRAFQKTFPYCR